MAWKPIDTAPKDGTLILCWRKGWDHPCLLRWKTNPRVVEAKKNSPQPWMENFDEQYFGDPVEMDDIDDFAVKTSGPTHWHPLEPTPK
jgi:hypothetical protein